MTARRTPRYTTYELPEYAQQFHRCVMDCNIKAVENMLDGGFDVNGIFANRTALQTAAGLGEIKLINLLLDFGADVNLRARSDNFTPLMQAALETPDDAVFAVLLGAGARLDDVTHGGMSAVMIAAESSNLDGVRVLIAAGADIYLRTPAGQSAYDIAVKQGHSECAALLHEVMSRKGLYRAKTLSPLSIKPAPRPK